jgi:hypothetical protein
MYFFIPGGLFKYMGVRTRYPLMDRIEIAHGKLNEEIIFLIFKNWFNLIIVIIEDAITGHLSRNFKNKIFIMWSSG